jgi:hypothetical protein
MNSDRSFNGKDFIEGDWTTDDITEESTYAYNRWRVAQRRAQIQEETAAQARFENMSADDVAAEYRQKLAEEEAANRPQREYWAARQFLSERPDYVVSPRNAKRMEEYMHAAKLDTTDPDAIHKAAKALEDRGLLQLDLNKIPVAPRTHLSEEEMYQLPMEELERRAALEARNRR